LLDPAPPDGGFPDLFSSSPADFFSGVSEALRASGALRPGYSLAAFVPSRVPSGRVIIPVPGVTSCLHRVDDDPGAASIPPLLGAAATGSARALYAFVADRMVAGSFPAPAEVPTVVREASDGLQFGLWDLHMMNRALVAYIVAALRHTLPAYGDYGLRILSEVHPAMFDAALSAGLLRGPFSCVGTSASRSAPVVPLAGLLIAWLSSVHLPLRASSAPPPFSFTGSVDCDGCLPPARLCPGQLSCPRCDAAGGQRLRLPAYVCSLCAHVTSSSVCCVGASMAPVPLPRDPVHRVLHSRASAPRRAMAGASALLSVASLHAPDACCPSGGLWEGGVSLLQVSLINFQPI
jgi:hypothetical protein